MRFYRSLASTACSLVLAVNSPAQSQPDTAAAASSPRAAVEHLIQAARRADWKTMRPYFPAGTRWEAIIESMVLSQDTSRAYSFWFRGVGINPDSLKVQTITPDSAVITTPYRIRGADARWEAVMVRRNARWVLARTKESYGRSERLLP